MVQRRQFLWAFGALAGARTALAAEDGPRILASIFPVHLFVRNIVKDVPGVALELMLPASKGCPHGYDLTPADMKRVAAAKILVLHGAGLEEFSSKKLKAANETITVIAGAHGLKVLFEDGHEGDQHDHGHEEHDHKEDAKKPGEKHDHDHDHGHDEGNPHLASSPRRAAAMVRNIAADLGKADPPNAVAYAKNGAAYSAKLEALADEAKAAVAKFANPRIVTQHEIFDYFAKDTGLEIVGRLRSGAGAEADAKKLVDAIRAKKAAAVFKEPQYEGKLAETIAEEAGVPTGMLDPVASGPDDAALDHYETTMRKNLAALAAACGQKG